MADVTDPPAWLRLPDGLTWPRPALDSDEHHSPAWRARYAPDSLTRGDQLYLAAVSDAYRALIDTPALARRLPEVRRALREQKKMR